MLQKPNIQDDQYWNRYWDCTNLQKIQAESPKQFETTFFTKHVYEKLDHIKWQTNSNKFE